MGSCQLMPAAVAISQAECCGHGLPGHQALYPPARPPSRSRPAPEALRTLRSTLTALGTGMPAADAVGAASLRDQCQSCKTIVMEAAAILQASVRLGC